MLKVVRIVVKLNDTSTKNIKIHGKYFKIGTMESSLDLQNFYIQSYFLQKLCQSANEFFHGGDIKIRAEEHRLQRELRFRQLSCDK